MSKFRIGDYVKYRDKICSVKSTEFWYLGSISLLAYKDLEPLEFIGSLSGEVDDYGIQLIPDLEVLRLRSEKDLPTRKFTVGDRVRLRKDISILNNPYSSENYNCTFKSRGFETEKEYNVESVFGDCFLRVDGHNVHEFEVELVGED